jgi:hypothetical protein
MLTVHSLILTFLHIFLLQCPRELKRATPTEPSPGTVASCLVSGQARVRVRRDRPRDRFEEVLEWTHGGLIVEQYRTALLNLVPDVRSVVVVGGQPDDQIHVINFGLDDQLLQ